MGGWVGGWVGGWITLVKVTVQMPLSTRHLGWVETAMGDPASCGWVGGWVVELFFV